MLTVWLIIAYIAGFGFTYGATEKLGENNCGGSFTGDPCVDMWCCILWPLTWLLWLPAQIGKKV